MCHMTPRVADVFIWVTWLSFKVCKGENFLLYIPCWGRQESRQVETGRRRVYMCHMTHFDVRHPNFYIYLGVEKDKNQAELNWVESGHRRIHICHMTHFDVHHRNSFIYLGVEKGKNQAGLNGSHTYSYLWHDSFWCTASEFLYIPWCWERQESSRGHASPHRANPPYCRQWKVSASDMLWHDSCISVTWLIHMRDMTHSYVPWLNVEQAPLVVGCDVWHALFMCVAWHTQTLLE